MILIIQINSIPFHYFEFVKPIEDTVRSSGASFSSVHYKNISIQDVEKAGRIIIAGTSLKDNTYLEDIEQFNWIQDTKTPILGICGGMQLLAACFDEQIGRGQEIGLHSIHLSKEFLGEKNHIEVYELHNNYVETSVFDVIASSYAYPQVIVHPNKPFYGVLFHPEVRNKSMITRFINDQY